jgi:hypothetical protein
VDRARVMAAVDHFIDTNALSNAELVERARADAIHVFVDLKGWTAFSRAQVLIGRPAPIQVNWLGFPGTYGIPETDYIIADPFLIPPGAEGWYTEAVVRLPDTYQPNDRQRVVAPAPTRAEAGLPEGAFVFGSLNQTYKITRAVFAGVQASFGRVLASATARYANIGGREDRGILATLTIPLGRNHFSTASYDSVTRQARFEARRVRDITVPEFDYGLIAERTPLFGRLTGQARYANSRFNLDVEMVGTRAADGSGMRDSNIVNFRLQSGIAFADGEFGIGRNPGRGFVMVDRHASLKEASVEVETSGIGRRAGQSNKMGPAVISQLSGYRPDNIRVSVLGAPPGYDIGAGEYLTQPGAASGVRLTIGSDAFRSALVTFVMPDGTPVKLADGVVRNLATGETSGVFTNAAGRAVLSKLGEGRYRVEFVGGDLVFEFAVDESAPAIIRLGTQKVEVAP